jgi:hypothetical protein
VMKVIKIEEVQAMVKIKEEKTADEWREKNRWRIGVAWTWIGVVWTWIIVTWGIIGWTVGARIAVTWRIAAWSVVSRILIAAWAVSGVIIGVNTDGAIRIGDKIIVDGSRGTHLVFGPGTLGRKDGAERQECQCDT